MGLWEKAPACEDAPLPSARSSTPAEQEWRYSESFQGRRPVPQTRPSAANRLWEQASAFEGTPLPLHQPGAHLLKLSRQSFSLRVADLSIEIHTNLHKSQGPYPIALQEQQTEVPAT